MLVERRASPLALGRKITMIKGDSLSKRLRWMIAPALLVSSMLLCASCASLSQEEIVANEQSRVQQERKGYFDRESSVQQKRAEQRAAEETLRRKK
jgi:hypothetical protein